MSEQTRQASNLGSNTAVKMTVKGNCGQIHTFEEWQKCRACGPVVDWVKENEIWNAAIEAAIKFMITNKLEEGLYERMRKELKK